MTEPSEESSPTTTEPSTSAPWRILLVLVLAVMAPLAFLITSRAQPRQTEVSQTPPRELYVAVDGRPDADGSIDRPLALATALADDSPANPGDTVWLRGGTYQGPFTSAVSGGPQQPIRFRGYLGERVIIENAPSRVSALTVTGTWTEFWDLEITNSDTLRVSNDSGSWPEDLRRSSGVDAKGAHNKLINLVIHDMADGIGIWSEAEETGAYGNVIFYNGWEAPDRSHGHGIYTQNRVGHREIVGNIIFDQFSHGIHAYGSSAAYLDNITLRNNIVFGNGSIAKSGGERDILLGGGRTAHNAVVEGNATYGAQSNVGYSAGCEEATIASNVFFGLSPLILQSCTPAMTDNTFIGPMGPAVQAFPANRYIADRGQAKGTIVMVHRNPMDASRAAVAIYNFDRLPSVKVDLSSVLADGQPFEIIDVQNLFGTPVVSATYRAGSLVAVPMTSTTVTPIVGNVSRQPKHTSPDFGAFLVRTPIEEPAIHSALR